MLYNWVWKKKYWQHNNKRQANPLAAVKPKLELKSLVYQYLEKVNFVDKISYLPVAIKR